MAAPDQKCRGCVPIDLPQPYLIMTKTMKKPYSHTPQYISQLKGIEQDIAVHELVRATQKLNELAKTSSHDPRLFLLGARLAEAAGNPKGVLLAARRAHELAPQWPVATIHLAEVLTSQGERQEALAVAGMAIQQSAAQVAVDTELLSKAVTIAQSLGEHDLALQWLRNAERASPDDLNIRYHIALGLAATGRHVEAITVFTDLLQKRPGNVTLLSNRMWSCLRVQQLEQAIQDGEALVALDPGNEVHAYYLSIARGETPRTQPVSVISELFDGYATRFDQELVKKLRYKLPRDVAEMIHQWHPDRMGDILDLGCGTGLLGLCLGPLEGVLVGVDLSAEMISQATRHEVYDKFHRVNVLDALQATPPAQYHVITALDVFVYVGNLDSVMADAYRILLPGGRFVCSFEATTQGDADYALPSTLRYTHQRGYVQRLLVAAGFEDIVVEDRVLRHELNEPVQGFLVIARKRVTEPEKAPGNRPEVPSGRVLGNELFQSGKQACGERLDRLPCIHGLDDQESPTVASVQAGDVERQRYLLVDCQTQQPTRHAGLHAQQFDLQAGLGVVGGYIHHT